MTIGLRLAVLTQYHMDRQTYGRIATAYRARYNG